MSEKWIQKFEGQYLPQKLQYLKANISTKITIFSYCLFLEIISVIKKHLIWIYLQFAQTKIKTILILCENERPNITSVRDIGRAGPTARRTRRPPRAPASQARQNATEKEKSAENEKSTFMHPKVLATGWGGRQKQVLPRAPKWLGPVLDIGSRTLILFLKDTLYNTINFVKIAFSELTQKCLVICAYIQKKNVIFLHLRSTEYRVPLCQDVLRMRLYN